MSMTKAASKKTTKKTTDNHKFQPNKVSLAVSALAAIFLVILGLIATIG